jgi:hypothetical protein
VKYSRAEKTGEELAFIGCNDNLGSIQGFLSAQSLHLEGVVPEAHVGFLWALIFFSFRILPYIPKADINFYNDRHIFIRSVTMGD